MRHIFFGAVFATVVALAAISPHADAQQSTPQSFTREQIEQIIREYLLANPEVIIEAVEGLEAKRRGEAEASRRNALAAKQDELV